MLNLKTVTYEDIKEIEDQFRDGGNPKDDLGYKIIEGLDTSKILISCPHSVSQVRKGKEKKREVYVGTMSLYLQQLTGCHLIYKTKDMQDDANTLSEERYRPALINYIRENEIELVIDLHGAASKFMDIELGTYHDYNIGNNKTILKNLYNVLIDHDITSIRKDRILWAGPETISHTVKEETGVNAIQIEVGRKFRGPKTRLLSFKNMVEAIEQYITSFDYAGAKEQIKTRNYFLDYDNVLEIKPSFGYIREIGKVPKHYIGMELEIGVNYEREKYSFIKKMLRKIKNVVGDKGYFVHDFTVISDYSFEIVMDPLPVEELVKIYAEIKEILKHSSSHLFSNSRNNCGIHFNFNKQDVENLDEAHLNLTNLMFNEREYFIYNLYKKSKFKLTYNDYLEFQKGTGSKYVAVNYLSSKVIEIRNINPNLTHEKLKELSEKLLYALYGIPYNEVPKEYTDFINIYEKTLKKIKIEDVEKIYENDYLIIKDIKKSPKLASLEELKTKNFNK